jgi:hypothetical protein
LQIIDSKKIKFLQKTWFKRDKESRLSHVFLLEILIRIEKRDKAKSQKNQRIRRLNGKENGMKNG